MSKSLRAKTKAKVRIKNSLNLSFSTYFVNKRQNKMKHDHISVCPSTVHEKNRKHVLYLFVLVCFVENSPISRRHVSDEPSPDICRPPPWLVDDTQVDRRHSVGVSQRADGVEAGAGEDERGEVGSLVVLAANDPRHQREGGWVGQHVAGVPVERREGAVARTPQVRAQLV